MSQKCHKNVIEISQKSHRNVTEMSQKGHRKVTEMSQKCPKKCPIEDFFFFDFDRHNIGRDFNPTIVLFQL